MGYVVGRRRTRAAAAVATLAVVGLLSGGCGSGSPAAKTTPLSTPGHSSTPRHNSPTPPPPSLSTNTPASGGAKGEISKAFVDFFSGSTPAAKKIQLVQDGQAFSRVINAQASSPLAKGTTATVSKVTVNSSTEADVVYTISLAGTPALKNQAGQAVNEQGTWKVAAGTFCTLLTLEQSAPPLCKRL